MSLYCKIYANEMGHCTQIDFWLFHIYIIYLYSKKPCKCVCVYVRVRMTPRVLDPAVWKLSIADAEVSLSNLVNLYKPREVPTIFIYFSLYIFSFIIVNLHRIVNSNIPKLKYKYHSIVCYVCHPSLNHNAPHVL